MNKVLSAEDAISKISEGSSVMVGGSMALGTPELLIDTLVNLGTKNLTIICNDGGIPGRGVSKLIHHHQVRKLIATHVGLNPEVTEQSLSGELECELIPQGSFAERIRSAGAGLGGFLTPTGIGTIVEKGKDILDVDGHKFILEKPLKADFALIRGSVVDGFGNVFYRGTTQNQSPLMASAADYVIASALSYVAKGQLDPHLVATPGIYVNAIVKGEQPWQI